MHGKGVNRFMPVQLNNDSSEKKLKASQGLFTKQRECSRQHVLSAGVNKRPPRHYYPGEIYENALNVYRPHYS